MTMNKTGVFLLSCLLITLNTFAHSVEPAVTLNELIELQGVSVKHVSSFLKKKGYTETAPGMFQKNNTGQYYLYSITYNEGFKYGNTPYLIFTSPLQVKVQNMEAQASSCNCNSLGNNEYSCPTKKGRKTVSAQYDKSAGEYRIGIREEK